MRQSENSGRYTGTNSIGCVGAYQFCGGTKSQYFPGMSDAQIMANPAAQDAAFSKLAQDNWRQMKAAGACSIMGQTIDGVKMTPAALVGAAHLGGAPGVNKFIRTRGGYNPGDGQGCNHTCGTHISQYAQKFGGFDLSGCGMTCP
jgi:hypothetical protein